MKSNCFRGHVAAILALGVAALAALSPSEVFSATFVVASGADSGVGTLRQAILAANAAGGGSIVFSNVTGVIALGSPLPVITASVNILGPGRNLLGISGGNQYTLFQFGAGTTNLLSNLTLANAYAQSVEIMTSHGFGVADFPGCAVSNAGAMTIANCVISNCINGGLGSGDDVGGAVFNSGSLGMQNCVFTGCGSSYEDSGLTGGCIYNSGTLSLTNCWLTNCNAANAAGIFNSGTAVLNACGLADLSPSDSEGNGGAFYSTGSLTLISCLVSNCSGGWEGGAVAGSGILASNTVFAWNTAAEEGGCLYLEGTNSFRDCTIANCGGVDYGGGGVKNLGNSSFVNCTFSGNYASYSYGGAIYNLGVLALTNCTISGNSCGSAFATEYGGGGILNSTTDPGLGGTYSNVLATLVDCTIVSNSAASGPGGGILNTGGAVLIVQNSIIAGNGSSDFSGLLTGGGFNLIQSTNGCLLTGDLTGDRYGLDPRLGPLQFNGGMTMTHGLLAGSPAIDGGPVNAPPYFDQRGVSRPQGAADDIGAFESGSLPRPSLGAPTPAGNGGFQLSFAGIAGFTYTLQRASSPGGPWSSLTSAEAAYGGAVSCLDTNPLPQRGFYRALATSD